MKQQQPKGSSHPSHLRSRVVLKMALAPWVTCVARAAMEVRPNWVTRWHVWRNSHTWLIGPFDQWQKRICFDGVHNWKTIWTSRGESGESRWGGSRDWGTVWSRRDGVDPEAMREEICPVWTRRDGVDPETEAMREEICPVWIVASGPEI